MTTQTQKISDISKAISELTLLQAADLAKELEQILGVSAAMMMPAAAAAPSGDSAEKPVEKTIFDASLMSIGDNKINVIKSLREVTTLGLKEAKDFVEGSLPSVIKGGIKKDEAEKIKAKLESAGAKVEIK